MLGCDEEYIGESARAFGERLKEHFRAPSTIYDHANTTGHHNSEYNFSTMGRESQNLGRTIKKVMYIKVNDPSLKRNIWKYQFSSICNEVLSALQTSSSNRSYNIIKGLIAIQTNWLIVHKHTWFPYFCNFCISRTSTFVENRNSIIPKFSEVLEIQKSCIFIGRNLCMYMYVCYVCMWIDV